MSSGSEHQGAEGGQQQQPSPFPSPSAHYRFNLEELRVLRQCNKESFYQRSLPLSTVLSIGTYYAVKNGFMKPNPNYGAIPKMAVAGIVGYFLGKFSYQSKCAEKLMQLPNSPIGEMLRQRKHGMHQEVLPDSSSLMWTPTESVAVEPVRELDERPMYEGFENFSRTSLEGPIVEDEDDLPHAAPHAITYDELRRKNREEYEAKKSKMGYSRAPSSQLDASVPAVSTFDVDHSQKKTEAKNKYGDVWEE